MIANAAQPTFTAPESGGEHRHHVPADRERWDGAPSVDTVTITINADNDAPINNVPVAPNVDEDTTLELSGGNGNAILVSDCDGNVR